MRTAQRFTHLLALLSLVFTLVPSSPVQAASRKLSDLKAPGGIINAIQMTPDKTRLIYSASFDRMIEQSSITQHYFDLYSRPVGDGIAINLSSQIISSTSVLDFKLSPNGQYLVFSMGLYNGQSELYSVLATGGTPIRLTPPYTSTQLARDDLEFAISADSTQVVYALDQSRIGQTELYRVAITGGAPLRLNNVLRYENPYTPYYNWQIGNFVLSADDQVIYREGMGYSTNQLYRVPLDRSSEPLFIGSASTLTSFSVSPDGAKLAFVGYDGTNKLFLAGTDGSGLTAVFTATNTQFDYQFTPDSTRLIASKNENNNGMLVSIPTAGGALTVLDDSMFALQEPSFRLSPDGQQAIYIDKNGDAYTLTGITVTTATKTALSGAFPSLTFYDLAISSAASRVLYRAGSSNTNYHLYSTPLSGLPSTQLDDLGNGTQTIYDFRLSTDGNYAVYNVGTNGGNVDKLYSVPVSGGESPTPLIIGSFDSTTTWVNPLLITNAQVYFSAALRNSGSGDRVVDRLYRVALDGSTPQVLIDRSRTTHSDVQDGYLLTSDGQYAVYRADAEVDNRYDLFSVKLPDGAPVRLNGENATLNFKLSPDGTKLVFIENNTLYITAITGGIPAPLYNMPAEHGIIDYAIVQNQVAFLSGPFLGPFQLYHVPLSGGTALPVDDDVKDFKLAGTTRLVYRATATNGIAGLFSTVLDDTPPIELYTANEVKNTYQISNDGNYVVYQSHAGIFSSPVTGGTFTAVTTNYPSGTNIDQYSISADSSHVLFTTNYQPSTVYSSVYTETLYSAPLTGGTTSELLSQVREVNGSSPFFIYKTSPSDQQVAVLVTNGSIITPSFQLLIIPLAGGASTTVFSSSNLIGGTFAFTADNDHLIFTNNGSLYNASLTNATVVALSSRETDGFIHDFTLSPDTTKAAYIRFVRRTPSDGKDLFVVPLTNGPPQKVSNLPPYQNNQVKDFFFTPSNLLVYRADQQRLSTFDLFIADASTATPAFTSTTLATSENAGPLAIPLRLSTTSQLPLSFTLRQVGGTAVAGSDYSLPNATITFPAGATEQTLNLNLLDPPGYQGERTLVLGLFPAGTALAQNDPLATLTITIADNEAATRYVYLPMLKK